MKKNRFHSAFSLPLIGLLILFLAGSVVPPSHAALAASKNAITLSAVQDAYTDINAATTNFDAGLLTAANSPGAPEEGDITTKQIYLEFDLSGVDFEIKRATLNLATLTCGGLVPVDVVDLAIYGVDNSSNWDEATLTWETQPDTSTAVLATLDFGSTTFNSNSYYTWTDDQQGDLATWLESQRGANDSSATLVIQIENSNDPGLADVFFEDREGSGAAYGCPNVLGSPSLQVSDIWFELYLPVLGR